MVPAAHGDYLIIRPVRNYLSGMMDLKKKTIVKLNEKSALEMRNGEVGLYEMEGNNVLATAQLPPASGGLRKPHASVFTENRRTEGRVFGDYATVSPNGKLLCVTNESGKLDIYTVADMQRVEQFVFTGSLRLVEFNEDGKKLLVLTSNQTAHVFDISSL